MKKLIGFLFITVFSINTSFSQEVSEESKILIRIEPQFGFGIGFKNVTTGIITSQNDTVTISAGGGVYYGGLAGITLNRHYDISLGFYWAKSSLLPAISNGSGTFKRFVIEPQFQYAFIFNKTNSLNAGIGLRASLNGKLDVDVSQIVGGAHNIFTYDNAFGPIVTGTYNLGLKKLPLRFSFGLKYYYQSFNLNAVSSNGTDIPLQYIPDDFKADLDPFKGSGLDFCFGIAYLIPINK